MLQKQQAEVSLACCFVVSYAIYVLEIEKKHDT